MYHFYALALLLTGAVLLSQIYAQANPPPPPGCELILCQADTVCVYVAACPTCPAQAQCPPSSSVDPNIDNKCQQLNYSRAILLDKKTCYSQLECTKASPQCPQGSVCVETSKGRGICCRDEPFSSQPSTNQPNFRKEKPGVCPGNILICGGRLCKNDRQCPGSQKCCAACGNQICSDPIIKCGNGECKPGEICVPKQRPCAPGRVCIQALIDTCVPAGCAKCTYLQTCQETFPGYVCTNELTEG